MSFHCHGCNNIFFLCLTVLNFFAKKHWYSALFVSEIYHVYNVVPKLGFAVVLFH